MHAKAYNTGNTAVGRRRRHGKRIFSRVCNALSFLLLILAAVRMVPLLTGCVQSDAVEFGQGATKPLESFQTFPSDTQAPEILGVKDFDVSVGDTAAYRAGITVTDDSDPEPSLEVDSSAVDLTTPGAYVLKYTATDAAGNHSTAIATVNVFEKQEDAADADAISEAADAVIAQIITDDMTTREQVFAIYDWAHTSLSYGGHSDRSDWHQAAYEMLTEGTGDCYGYFAVTKLLFEQLEIPNIDVVKVKNYDGDSEHYWSLVSVDGGENYYHFDATPRKGQLSVLCLVTDAFLDEFSARNSNCHNRDTSLYPATPEE